jgi:hypothetical protein
LALCLAVFGALILYLLLVEVWQVAGHSVLPQELFIADVLQNGIDASQFIFVALACKRYHA